MEKTQAVIDLMQSIIQTYKPTWTDCRQLLLTAEQRRTTALKQKIMPEVTLNAQAYTQAHFPEEDPHWDPSDDRDYQ
jgi:hypothetical protein